MVATIREGDHQHFSASLQGYLPKEEHGLLSLLSRNVEKVTKGRRLAVEHVLDMLTAGDSPAEILAAYPWHEKICASLDSLSISTLQRESYAFDLGTPISLR